MKAIFLFFMVVFAFSSYAKDERSFDERSLLKIEDMFGGRSNLVIVQSRKVPRKYTSEFYIDYSQNLKGFNYSNTGAFSLGYKFHISNYWALGLEYAEFFNSLNSAWTYERAGNQIPSSLIYYPKNAFGLSGDWYAFYGKSLIFGTVVHFDIYTSLKLGVQSLNKISRVPYIGLGAGFVFWWNQFLNSRIELQEAFYQHSIEEGSQSFGNTKEIPNECLCFYWIFVMKIFILLFYFGFSAQAQTESYPFLKKGGVDFNLNQYLDMDMKAVLNSKADDGGEFLKAFEDKNYDLALSLFLKKKS